MTNDTLYQFTPGTVAQSAQVEANDFATGAGDLFPRNPVTGVVADAAGSLGDTLIRFKEAHIRDTIGLGGYLINAILDEDDMASNRADALASQQSIKAYVDNMDFVGTVFVASTSVSAVIPYTKVAGDNILRFSFSGSVIGNAVGSVLISIADIPYSVTYPTQGPPVSFSNGITGGQPQSSIVTSVGAANNSQSAALTGLGATGASPLSNGLEIINIRGLSVGLHNITITFTNISSPFLAIYTNYHA